MPTPRQAGLLLKSFGSSLLLEPQLAPNIASHGSPQAEALARARAVLGPKDTACLHFDQVLAHAQHCNKGAAAAGSAPLVAPMTARGAVPAVGFFGRHGNRTPLSYAPFRQATGNRLNFVDDLADADVLLTGYNVDLHDNADMLARLLKRSPHKRLAVISEEPLWDSLWSGGFTARDRVAKIGGKDVPYLFLNHQNSDLFEFEHIPYFLLTNDSFVVRYHALLAAQSHLSPEDMLKRWQAAPLRAAFFAEVRKDAQYAQAFPEQDVLGLSTYRTKVAEELAGQDTLCVGQGWHREGTTPPRRQVLADWHLDKLVTLQNRCRVLSAYENTHQRAYVSEKIFDAFAVGAVPTYFANPQHRVFDLVREEAILNTFGLDVAAAAARIADFKPGLSFARAYLATQADLCNRFGMLSHAVSERGRMTQALVREIHTLA